MKAVLYEAYGPPEVLEIRDLPKPEPESDEVLIRVHAAPVTTGDVNIRGFVFVPKGFRFLARLMFGIRKPRKQALGVCYAGEVEAIGDKVTQFKAGDRVFGIDSKGLGSFAEYVCKGESSPIAAIPDSLSYEEAAAIPFGAHTALYFIEELGKVKEGDHVLINGAAGSIGIYATQMVKNTKARVTAICSSSKVELVRSLGADRVIDYTQEPIPETKEAYSHILDCAGKLTFSKHKYLLKKDGKFLAPAAGIKEMLGMIGNLFRKPKLLAGTPVEKAEPLRFLAGQVASGKLKSVIDQSYPMNEIIEAHRHVDGGHKKGSVIVRFQ